MTINNILNNALKGQSGSGAFAGNISPSFTTPILGAASATSLSFGSTALSNFEVGTWTPTFTYQVPGTLSVAYTVQVGIYMRINNWVYIQWDLRFTPTNGTASSAARMAGLPFARSSASTPIPILYAFASNATVAANSYTMNFSPVANQTFGTFMTGVSATTPPTLGISTNNFPTATAIQIYGFGWYQI